MKPLVSILIPAFNSERTIGETLRSAIAQNWQEKEIIVVDDGSKDQTALVVRGFAKDGVKLVSQKNQGASAARNRALSCCQGDYIQWLDADDILARDKISRQMDAFDPATETRLLLSGPWGSFLHRHRRAKFTASPLWCDLSPAEWLVRKMSHNLFMQTATWLVSRELTDSTGPWNTNLLGDDDGEYFCRILLNSDGVRFVRGANVFYRAPTANSLSVIGQSDRKLDAQWSSMKLHIDYLRSLDDSPRAHQACVKYLQNWVGVFYPERIDLVEEARAIVTSLGGQLEIPKLSWKYSWIDKAFGRKTAKRAQNLLLCFRWSVQRSWDRALFRLENRDDADLKPEACEPGPPPPAKFPV